MIGIIGTLGLTGILGMPLLTGVAIGLGVIQVGVSIYQAVAQGDANEAASNSADEQATMQKQNLIRQGYQNSKNQIAAGHLQKTQATKTKMQAGSAVKINEFANKRAKLKTAMHHDKIRENLHLRASRPTGNPHIT